MAASPSTLSPAARKNELICSPSPSVAFDVEVSDTNNNVNSPSMPKRVRRRLLETSNGCRSPASREEIEAKLKDAESRRQQFHDWLIKKAKPKTKTTLQMLQPDSLAQRIQTRLEAAEQKRLDLQAQEQMRLARTDEIRIAARTEVQLRAEREREELESRVESRVSQAENNRLALLEAEKQKRAAVNERVAMSIVQRTTQEDKDRERVKALRALICQKIAAASEKRKSLITAERTRAQALVLQARQVAKAVSRKREIASQNKRELLEARMQKAKRVRADYLGQRGSVQGMSLNERLRMKKHGEHLSRKLIRCWRIFQTSKCTTFKLASDFGTCSIKKNEVTSLPFEDVATRITSPATLRSVKALLARLEKRFFLSAASKSDVAKLDHLLERLVPQPKKAKPQASCGVAKRPNAQTSSAVVAPSNHETSLERYPARAFLCAYMIIGHPEAVFNVKGEREAELSKNAIKLVDEFESLFSVIIDGPQSYNMTPSHEQLAENENTQTRSFATQLAEFDSAWCAYLYQFVAWKVQDAHQLEEDLIRVACQLERSMMQKFKPLGENGKVQGSHDYKAIQKQVLEDQTLLKERIRGLTGADGVSRMEAALVKTRAQPIEVQPRGKGKQPPSPSVSPVKPSNSMPCDQDLTSAELNSSYGKFLSERVSDNERMVNEMLHDPNWCATPKPTEKLPNFQIHIKATIEDVFWKMVIEELTKTPPNYERVITLFREVKEELQKIVPENWKQELNESLDIDIFCQILQSGNPDLAYFKSVLEYAMDMVIKLGAPARDNDARESVKNLFSEISPVTGEKQECSFGLALVKGLRFVLEQIQVLKSDISTAKIQALAPIVQGTAGIEYLQKNFAERYGLSDSHSVNQMNLSEKLPKTYKWLTDMNQYGQADIAELEALYAACKSNVSEKEVEKQLIPSEIRSGSGLPLGKTSPSVKSKPTTSEEPKVMDWKSVQSIVGLATLRSMFAVEAVSEERAPETLKLNVHRLHDAQNKYQHLIIMAAGLLVLRQTAIVKGVNGADLDALLCTGRDQLNVLLKDPHVAIPQIGSLLAKLSQASEDNVAIESDLMSRMMKRSLSPEDTIFKRVSSSIQTCVRAVLLLGRGAESLGMLNVPLQKIGAASIQEDVVELGIHMQKFASINCSVHGPWYNRIIGSE